MAIQLVLIICLFIIYLLCYVLCSRIKTNNIATFHKVAMVLYKQLIWKMQFCLKNKAWQISHLVCNYNSLNGFKESEQLPNSTQHASLSALLTIGFSVTVSKIGLFNQIAIQLCNCCMVCITLVIMTRLSLQSLSLGYHFSHQVITLDIIRLQAILMRYLITDSLLSAAHIAS